MLTIITTCKGRVHHLKGLVECLQKQTFRDWECVVVAYGCEETILYGRSLTIEDDRFTCLRKNAEGFNLSKARNLGVRPYIDDTELLLFLDADTIIPNGYLEEVLFSCSITPAPYFMTGEPHCSGNMLVRKDFFREVGGYDEGYEGWGAEDADMYIRLQREACLLSLPLPKGMSYQTHPESESDKFHSIKKWDAQKKNIQRLFSKYPKEWIVPEYIAPELVSRFI